MTKARFTHEVVVEGHKPIVVRNAWVAESVRKALARRYRTLAVVVKEKSR